MMELITIIIAVIILYKIIKSLFKKEFVCDICNKEKKEIVRPIFLKNNECFICKHCKEELASIDIDLEKHSNWTKKELQKMYNNKKDIDIKEDIRRLNFAPTKKYDDYLWLDQKNKQFFCPKDSTFGKGIVYNYSDIESIEVIDLWHSETENRGATIGQLAKARILGGSTGFKIASVQTNTYISDYCDELKIKITLKHELYKTQYITFINSTTNYYQTEVKTLQEIWDVLNNLIEDKEKQKTRSSSNDSIKQIAELKKMLDEGTITKEEFKKMK